MNKRGSLFHISKRDTLPLPKALAIRSGIILLALVFCGLITTLLTGENPINVYGTILKGAFGTVRKSWVTWQNVAILLGISLAVTPAFKMRFWNIGAEGQTLIGCLASAACMITLGKTLPNALLILVSLVAALLAGALWGFLPAFFKAHWNTNETLFTLMMNYIATQLTAFFIIIWEVPKGAGKIGIINQSSEAGWLPRLANQQYLLPILVIAIMTGLMYVYLQYSKHGYEIAVIGDSINTARYAGMNVGHVMMRTMFLSGAISGLVGFIVASGANTTLYDGVAAGVGFTSITVAWLSQLNAFAMIVISMMLAIISKGAETLQTRLAVPASISDIITGILLFCMLGCEFFINYRLIFRSSKTEKEAAKE